MTLHHDYYDYYDIIVMSSSHILVCTMYFFIV